MTGILARCSAGIIPLLVRVFGAEVRLVVQAENRLVVLKEMTSMAS